MDDTIFNYIDSVLFTKKKLNNLNEGETQFNLFMVNRWCSMYSPDIAQIINQTSNQYKELHALNRINMISVLIFFLKSEKRNWIILKNKNKKNR
jgi:hypothetical protein